MEQLSGGDLSFNNLNDLNAARSTLREFTVPAAVIVKHANPCGCALAAGIEQAYELALAADPVSAYGGVVALNRRVEKPLARRLATQFVEVLIAPGYSEGALEELRAKASLRILEDGERRGSTPGERDYRRVLGGMLVQDADAELDDRDGMKVVTVHAPSETGWGDLIFAWRVAKHLTSNAIVIAKDLQTVGIGGGQTSRVDAVRLAIEKAPRPRARPERGRTRLGRVLPVRGRSQPGPRRRRHGNHPAGRLEARLGSRRRSRAGRRDDGLHVPPPLSPLEDDPGGGGGALPPAYNPPVAREYPTVLDLVGRTPLVRLQRLSRGVEPTLLAKLEYMNPGGSVKDRIGLRMIEQAEREGKLRPGGTIVEPTSGNTGVGLAIAAALRGYRCVFVMPDKIAEEKRALLRAYGAEVVICPTAVEPESPESYYSVSDRLAEEIPGAYKPDQYSNPANPEAHYETTGPELWDQTDGEIDAIVFSVGTGGTISGTARYLRERKPDLLVVGADPEGSIYSSPEDVHPYLVEGIGEDFWPRTYDPSLVDEYVTVSDRDSFRTARRLAREEGMLVGGSGGTAVWAMLQVARRFGPDATIVTLIPDSGRGYLSKVYDDNWLLEHGFLERATTQPTIEEVLAFKQGGEVRLPELVLIESHENVGQAIELMQRYGISQIPVVRHAPAESLADIVGSIRERGLLERVFLNEGAMTEDVAGAMEPPLPAVEIRDTVDTVFADLSSGSPAVVVAREGRPAGVLTRADLLEYLAHERRNG